jgi:hypothetical protein
MHAPSSSISPWPVVRPDEAGFWREIVLAILQRA